MKCCSRTYYHGKKHNGSAYCQHISCVLYLCTSIFTATIVKKKTLHPIESMIFTLSKFYFENNNFITMKRLND